MATTQVAGQRWTAVLILLVPGVFSLPVTAYFFDQGNENWIFPVAVALMALLGAIIGAMLPGVAGPDATSRRGALVGAAIGVGMLVVGTILFFLLINGVGGG